MSLLNLDWFEIMSTIWEHSWFQHDSDNDVSIAEGLNSSMWHWLAGQRRASTWWLVTWWELQLQWAIFTATPWCVNPSTKWMWVLSGCRGGGGGPLWSLQSCSPSLRLLTAAFATGENDGERTWDQSCELAQLLHNLSNYYVCPKFMYILDACQSPQDDWVKGFFSIFMVMCISWGMSKFLCCLCKTRIDKGP